MYGMYNLVKTLIVLSYQKLVITILPQLNGVPIQSKTTECNEDDPNRMPQKLKKNIYGVYNNLSEKVVIIPKNKTNLVQIWEGEQKEFPNKILPKYFANIYRIFVENILKNLKNILR